MALRPKKDCTHMCIISSMPWEPFFLDTAHVEYSKSLIMKFVLAKGNFLNDTNDIDVVGKTFILI